jgi:transposase, IS5 family
MKQLGLFGLSQRLKDLSESGDPLEKLNQIVDFEQFRSELEMGLNFSERLKGGRPPHDAVVVFKILILQTLYNLSDDQIEYQIRDRLSFMRFLGFHLSDKVPDSKTIWLYRERFCQDGLIDRLFSKFGDILVNQGYLAMGGQIVDASIIQAPRQRMTKAEKEQVKKGEIPKDWQAKPNQLAQKDLDARWMVKYTKAKDDTKGAVDLSLPFFGYKNHLSTDRRFGFIRKSKVTAANIFDGHILPDLLDSANTCLDVYGDTAYNTEENLTHLEKRGFRSKLHCKKPKRKPMPTLIKRGNTTKSRIRSHVEHVFAVQKEQMGLFVRTIGLKRAKVKIGLANLTYNMKRLIFWEQRKLLIG